MTAVRLVDWKRLAYALRASRFDAVLVVDSATNAGIVSVEYVRPAAGEIYYMV